MRFSNSKYATGRFSTNYKLTCYICSSSSNLDVTNSNRGWSIGVFEFEVFDNIFRCIEINGPIN